YMLAAREQGRVSGGHRIPAAPAWIDGPAVVAQRLGSTETTAQVHPARFTAALVDAARARRRAPDGRGRARDGAGPGRAERDRGWRSAPGRRGRSRDGTVDGPHRRRGAAAHPRAQGVQRNPRRAGRALEPEIMPRPDGTVYVCGMADLQPLPESAEGVEVSEAGCAVLAGAAGRVSAGLAAAPIERRQACYRPVTDDGVPLIGRVPGAPGVYIATGHGPWGMLNAPGTGLALAELIVDGTA